jgi:peptide/nickel transport system ATP-binding protein
MNVCASRAPINREHPNGSRAECWAADLEHGLARDLSAEDRAPLNREEISLADEA